MKTIREIQTALVGNPNCGKSTIFNALTGAKQTIGNFPGVTVERYEGRARFDGRSITLIDLPGVYSLSAFSDEERVAAEFLTREPPDVVVNIVDASRLERDLYLTLSLEELGKPTLVVLNMIDVAKRRGIEIDLEALSRELGLPVVAAIGNRKVGLDAILAEICRLFDQNSSVADDSAALNDPSQTNDVSLKNGDPSEPLLSDEKETATEPKRSRSKKLDFCSKKCDHCSRCDKFHSQITLQTEKDVAIYKRINRICVRAVRSSISLEPTASDRIDGLLTSRYFGLPIFFAAMFLVFQLTFALGQYPMDWLENGFAALSDAIARYWPDGEFSFLKSLIIDGVIGGVGGVLVFLPNILILFLAISFLEDSGYLARAALLCDRWMHKIGLHGRSVVPALIGFGCSVPAIMATRMLSDRRERLTTIFVLPLFSCGARFPIYALLIPAFFPSAWRGPVLWLIYLIGIALAAIVAKSTTFFFKQGEEAPFIIELPPYHCPTFRTVGIRTLERGWQYIKKAGTVILGISIVLWFLTNYPGISPQEEAKFERFRRNVANEAVVPQNLDDETAISGRDATFSEPITATPQPIATNFEPITTASEQTSTATNEIVLQERRLAEIDAEESQSRLSSSYAGQLGRFIEPALKPAGFDWKIGTALIGAIAAKEVFVAQLGIVYSTGESTDGDSSKLSDILVRQYSPLTGFCVIVFCLIATPCMATFATTAKETGSWLWAFAQWFFLTGLAWILTTAIYQLGRLFWA